MIFFWFTFLWLEMWVGVSWSFLLQVSSGPDGWSGISLTHIWWLTGCLLEFSAYFRGVSHGSNAVGVGVSQCVRAFQASTWIMVANISMVKTSYIARPRIKEGRNRLLDGGSGRGQYTRRKVFVAILQSTTETFSKLPEWHLDVILEIPLL